jgi:hypothetical protein
MTGTNPIRAVATLAALLLAVAADAQTAAETDFQVRCAAPGVVRCVGFDNEADFVDLSPAGDGIMRGSMDRAQKSSGAGSLRFEVPGLTGQNSSGYWLSDLGARFGAGQSMYFQFRFRLTPERLDAAVRGWKQFIVHSAGSSCAATQFVNGRYYGSPYMLLSTQCGSRRVGPDDPDRTDSVRLINSGDYYCQYKKESPETCATWVPNTWMTFYFEVDIGQLDTDSSKVRAWVAADGKPLRKFVDVSDFRIAASNGPGSTFARMQFTPYQTGKDSTVNHPTGYVWYDEFIVSTRPIPAPAINSGSYVPPAPVADETPPASPTGVAFQQR